MNKKVFVTRAIFQDAIDQLISAGVETKIWPDELPPTTLELINNAADCHGILSMITDHINKKVIDRCPNLEVISNMAVGVNNIDLKYAGFRGIKVGNTPDVLTQSTAELTIGLILMLCKNLYQQIDDTKHGKWATWHPIKNLGMELSGKTLGVFGMGRIGQKVASIASLAFGMKVIYHSRSNITAKQKIDANAVSFEKLLHLADIISIHCDLNEETFGLFSQEIFKQMKNNSMLINTSRGEIINQKDLETALSNGPLKSAAIDVTYPEPLPSNSKLFQLPNLIISPHIGSATLDARTKMANIAVKNILNAFNSENLVSLANNSYLQIT